MNLPLSFYLAATRTLSVPRSICAVLGLRFGANGTGESTEKSVKLQCCLEHATSSASSDGIYGVQVFLMSMEIRAGPKRHPRLLASGIDANPSFSERRMDFPSLS